MKESQITEIFAVIFALIGAILFFTGDSDEGKAFGIVLLIVGILLIVVLAPIFKAKEMAAKQKSKNIEKSENVEKQRKCPNCNKKMDADWEICPYCRANLNTEDD